MNLCCCVCFRETSSPFFSLHEATGPASPVKLAVLGCRTPGSGALAVQILVADASGRRWEAGSPAAEGAVPGSDFPLDSCRGKLGLFGALGAVKYRPAPAQRWKEGAGELPQSQVFVFSHSLPNEGSDDAVLATAGQDRLPMALGDTWKGRSVGR